MFKLFKESSNNFKKITYIALCAMLVALSVVFKAVTINLTSDLKVGFSTIFSGINGFLCGPLLAGVGGAIADILGFIVNPSGPYFPAFTLNELLIGLIYGIFFYQKEVSLPRTIAARATHTILINLILTPIWLNILYGSALFAIPRIIKNLILFPFDVALLYAGLKASKNIIKRIK